MSERRLTAKQLAERYNVAASTARAWFLNGIVPRAYLKETELGSFWVVPESALASFVPPKPGRPPKHTTTEKRATSQKQASNGRSAGKKKGKK